MPSTSAQQRIRILQTSAYYLVYIAIGLILSAIGPSLPTIAGQTGSTIGELGVLFSTLSLGRLAGALWLGRLFDRAPAHPLMAGMLIVMCILITTIPLVSTLLLLAVVFFLIGLPWGVVDVGVNTLLPWIWDKQSGPVMNGLHMFFGIGAIAAPLMVNTSLNLTGQIHSTFWVISALLLLVFLMMMRLPSPKIQTFSGETALQKRQWIFVAGVVLIILFCVGEEVAFGSWIYSYTLQMRLAGQDQAALLNSMYWGALLFGRLFAVATAARIDAKRTLVVDLFGCLAAVGIILLWPASTLAVWSGTVLLGFSIASIFPTMIVFTSREIALTSKITGLIIIGDAVGGMLLPWLSGVLFSSIGPESMMLKVFVSFSIALALFSALARSSIKPPLFVKPQTIIEG